MVVLVHLRHTDTEKQYLEKIEFSDAFVVTRQRTLQRPLTKRFHLTRRRATVLMKLRSAGVPVQ